MLGIYTLLDSFPFNFIPYVAPNLVFSFVGLILLLFSYSLTYTSLILALAEAIGGFD